MVRGLAQRSLAAALLAATYLAGLAFGGMAVGTLAPVTWLRLSHRLDPGGGEHEFQAATSRDGRHWTWGGTWTLPAGTRPRIGLIPDGGAGAVAEFDYLRSHQPLGP